MVEQVAKFLKEKVEEFLIFVEEADEQQDGNVGWDNEIGYKRNRNMR